MENNGVLIRAFYFGIFCFIQRIKFGFHLWICGDLKHLTGVLQISSMNPIFSLIPFL